MRLKAVEITPKGNVVFITGKNAAGKSSLLDGIMAAFCGKKYQPAKPIRDGEDHAEIVIETENYIIKRTFTAKGGGSVTVSNAEGMKASSPQGLLDKLVGEIAFEPMSFFKDSKDVKKQRQQRDMLMKLVGLDFADIDAEIAGVKDQRSTVKTSKDTYDFEAGQIAIPKDTPDEVITMGELTEKLTAATQHNKKHAEISRQIETTQKNIENINFEITHSLEHITTLKQEFETAIKNAEETHAAKEKAFEEAQIKQENLAKTLEPLIDVTAINKEIVKAEYINAHVRMKDQRRALLRKSAAKSKEYADLGKKKKTLEGKKAERLAAVEMPIAGLSVNEETILYEGIPLAQVNESMQLQIAVALSMALNPKLKVILMKGNDLDEENLETVCQMAKQRDYQVWIERWLTDKKNRTGFIIEDGSAVEAEDEDTVLAAAEKMMRDTVAAADKDLEELEKDGE